MDINCPEMHNERILIIQLRVGFITVNCGKQQINLKNLINKYLSLFFAAIGFSCTNIHCVFNVPFTALLVLVLDTKRV